MIHENESPKLTTLCTLLFYTLLFVIAPLPVLPNLVVTLLLGNVIVNETLPVVLDSELGGGVVAILISTFLIVVFGE